MNENITFNPFDNKGYAVTCSKCNSTNIKLNDKQKEILEWLFRHRQETAYSTWRLLFRERKSDFPDKCIAYYDELSPKEKSDVELIIARFFSVNKHLSIQQVFEDLSYEE